MGERITGRVNNLVENSKMLQNVFLQFLIRNKLQPVFQSWQGTGNTQVLSTIDGMPNWMHNFHLYCINQMSNPDKRQKFQEYVKKLVDDNGNERSSRKNITEKDVDSTFAIQLLLFEHYLFNHTVVNNKGRYKALLHNVRISRNVFSHYTPNVPNDNKLADVKNLLENLDDFTEYMIDDLNSRNEETKDLSGIKEKIRELRDELNDIVGERLGYIQYLSKVTAYVNRVKNEFIDMISKFVQLDIYEEAINGYSSSYVDEVLLDEKTVPRSGKIEDVLPTIEEKKMLLTGGPGVGKTTTLGFLAYKDACEFLENTEISRIEHIVPVLLHLNTLTKEDMSVIDKIAEEMKIETNQVKELLNKKKIRLFLDGLNEIPNADGSTLKQKRISEIKDICANYPETLIVCSTREGDAAFLKGFPCFRVLPMDDVLVKEFIEINTPSEEVKTLLLKEFDNTTGLLKNVRTPLYVTRLIAVVSQSGKMPRTEAEIIGAYLNSLLERERTDKAVDIDPKKINTLLAEFAYKVREKYKTNVPVKYATIINIFDEQRMFQKAKLYEILDICIDLEIISVGDEEQALYAFTHETYQEYYRAQVDDFTL